MLLVVACKPDGRVTTVAQLMNDGVSAPLEEIINEARMKATKDTVLDPRHHPRGSICHLWGRIAPGLMQSRPIDLVWLGQAFGKAQKL